MPNVPDLSHIGRHFPIRIYDMSGYDIACGICSKRLEKINVFADRLVMWHANYPEPCVSIMPKSKYD